MIGDFNVDLRSSCTEFLVYMESTFNCTQFQENATTDSGSIIDLVFSNSQVCAEVVETYWSDHKIIYCILDAHSQFN